MARYPYRANLNAGNFPMVSLYQGQTVIVRGQDNNYVPSVSYKADEDKDVGIPQVYYCHNVLPTGQGFAAVGYKQVAPAIPGVNNIDKTLTIRDDKGNVALVNVPLNGNVIYTNKLDGSGWNTIIIPAYSGNSPKITTAYVSGVTYIYVANFGCFIYNFTTNVLESVTLDGLDPLTVLGVVATSGYLLVWSRNAIAWSSTVDPTDFVPDLTTGAGGGALENAKGDIVACISYIGGFIAYTSENAVACSYSGNSRYPFNFREINGAGGLQSIELAATDGVGGTQYTYTTFGMQQVSYQQAQPVFPDVTDFISGSFMEDFNETTNTFEYTTITSVMLKKLSMIAARYVVISYGISQLTHALVYDISLKRMGKLKVIHTDCFELDIPVSGQLLETAKKSIAITKNDGSVFLVDTDFSSENKYGVIIAGKYKYTRTRTTDLLEVDVENVVESVTNFSVTALVSLLGKTGYEVPGYLLNSDATLRNYAFNAAVGDNISLLFKGNFNIVSLLLTMGQNGRM